jgi:hypothetical protein
MSSCQEFSPHCDGVFNTTQRHALTVEEAEFTKRRNGKVKAQTSGRQGNVPGHNKLNRIGRLSTTPTDSVQLTASFIA